MAQKKSPPPFDLRQLTEKSDPRRKSSSFLQKRKKEDRREWFAEGSFNPYYMHTLPQDYSFTLQETTDFAIGEIPCDIGISREHLCSAVLLKDGHENATRSLQAFVVSELQEQTIPGEIEWHFEEDRPNETLVLVEKRGEIEEGPDSASMTDTSDNREELLPSQEVERGGESEECPFVVDVEEDEEMEALDLSSLQLPPPPLQEIQDASELFEEVEMLQKVDLDIKNEELHSLDGLAKVVQQTHNQMRGEQTIEIDIPITGAEDPIHIALTTYQTAPTEYNLALTGMPPSAVIWALKNKAALIGQLAARGIRVHQLLLSESNRHGALHVRGARSKKQRIGRTVLKDGPSN
ncbi:hypothetical protein HAT2_00067 [Candidatus Similichlamydia laticola]|uniref:Uncharacterized protein n=1 Tax=Candidatus Similichlamydia laticola TaxID=2170265 RepID=A0A369KJ94_9BACT|nr:hypothetical protein HAT2_00067 [Candidatus Similichlamydia laticola]